MRPHGISRTSFLVYTRYEDVKRLQWK